MTHMPPSLSAGYEYDVVPAPTRIDRIPGLKTDGDRIACMIAQTFNAMADEGWEYVRADVIQIDNVTGISGNIPKPHTLLVFRRPLSPQARQPAPLVLQNRVG